MVVIALLWWVWPSDDGFDPDEVAEIVHRWRQGPMTPNWS